MGTYRNVYVPVDTHLHPYTNNMVPFWNTNPGCKCAVMPVSFPHFDL
jgi:hypothetical protein